MASDSSPNEIADILEAALDGSFANIPPPPPPDAPTPVAPSSSSPSAPVAETTTTPTPASAPSEPSGSSANPEAWKDDYEAQLQSWRAQSAEAREKAEKERAKWEEYRKAHPESTIPASPLWETTGLSGVIKVPSSSSAGAEAKSSASTSDTSTPTTSAVDVRVPSSSVGTGSPGADEDEDNASSSHKWEDVPSDVSSSYPSMSFPDQIDTPPSKQADHSQQHPSSQQQPPPPPPVSVTLSIFDGTLSTRTRLAALASALTVNLLLPFVNGVMLGFGEIFAKNVVMGWLGWGSPIASSVGVRAGSREKRASLFK